VADRKGNREDVVVICANSALAVVIIVLSRTIFSTRSSRGMLWIRETRSQDSFSNLLREIREAFDVKGNSTQGIIAHRCPKLFSFPHRVSELSLAFPIKRKAKRSSWGSLEYFVRKTCRTRFSDILKENRLQLKFHLD